MARSSAAQFAGNVHAPAQARRFATNTLPPRTTSATLTDVATIVSELVTNAVRAGAVSITVTLTLGPSRLRIQVTDAAAGWPTLRDARLDDVTGRGLALVAAIADEWGVDPADPTGKHVWATVPLAQAS